MAKFYVRLFIVTMLVAFCIFFGIDLASKGVERVQGPVGPAAPVKAAAVAGQPSAGKPEAKAAAAAPPAKQSAAGSSAKEKTPEPERSPVAADSGINRISNKAGELLQIMAYHGIQFVVSMLDAIVG